MPSLQLLSQSLRKWMANAEVDIRPFAVCCDVRVVLVFGAVIAIAAVLWLVGRRMQSPGGQDPVRYVY